MQPRKLTEDEIQATIRTAIQDAQDFVEAEVAEDRITAQRYYDGGVRLESEDGRSEVVATKVRDTIRLVKPALMRVFVQSDEPVEFIPTGPEDVQSAEQATKYVNYKFNECKGFRILSDVFHDALLKKIGITKASWDETEHVETDEYSNLPPEAVQDILGDTSLEVQEGEQKDDGTYDLTVIRRHTKGRLEVDSIAPEDFFWDRSATCIEDAYVVGDTAEMRVGDLVEMGFDFEEVVNLAGTDDSATEDEEEFYRDDYSQYEGDQSNNDPSMRRVLLTEAYMRMDIEGTGVPRLYQFVCAGTNHTLLDHKRADQIPYSVFETDPQPHSFTGDSLAELVIPDQDASTSLLRAHLDATHLALNPALIVTEGIGNVADAMNNEIGRVLREKVAGQGYREMITAPVANQTLPALQYYDQQIEQKTGVSRASAGLDPDTLQGTSATAANIANQAATAAIELMARNLAEGGLRDLFKKMKRLTQQHVGAETFMRLYGQFVPVDPRSWTSEMDARTNVGLGSGYREEQIMFLREITQMQMQFAQQGLITPVEMLNTVEDLGEKFGVYNVDRYFPREQITQRVQMMMQAQQAQQGQQGDPNAAYMQVEMGKVQQREMEAQREHQLDVWKAQAEDDRKRDQMEQEAEIKAAQIMGEFGIKISAEQIRQMQAQQRMQAPQPQPGPIRQG